MMWPVLLPFALVDCLFLLFVGVDHRSYPYNRGDRWLVAGFLMFVLLIGFVLAVEVS